MSDLETEIPARDPAADAAPAASPGLSARTATGAATVGASLLSPAAWAQTASTLGPKSTGTVGPGPFAGGLPDFRQYSTAGLENYESFGCKVYKGSPPTPDWATASVWFDRKIASHEIRMPDGKLLDFWVFEDELVGSKSRNVPSPLIRVQQGDLVHVRLNASKGPHTIHHHGIEPTTFNDGVGHVSMEVGTRYIYQWEANTPGTWIYHCHVNTPLHFEMGLYGAVVVDPRPDPVTKKVAAFEGGPFYDVEQFWVFDDIDPRWHFLDHGDGLCGEDVGLNIFEPQYFMVTGGVSKQGTSVAKARIAARQNQKILVRLINAAYSQVRVRIEGLEFDIISVDGHPLGKYPWNRPQRVAPGEEIVLATATRYDVLIDLASAANKAAILKKKTFRTEFEFVDWITWKRQNAGVPGYEGFAFSSIDVT